MCKVGVHHGTKIGTEGRGMKMAVVHREECECPQHLFRTSPILRAITLDDALLSKGVERVGEEDMPLHLWRETIPDDFLRPSKTRIEGVVGEVGDLAALMLKDTVDVGQHMFIDIANGDGGPNAWAFVVPKSAKKAAFIFRLASLNALEKSKLGHFALPTFQELAVLLQQKVGNESEGLGIVSMRTNPSPSSHMPPFLLLMF